MMNVHLNAKVAKKLAIASLKQPLQHYLLDRGLDWEEFLPVLAAVHSVDELKKAAANIPRFIEGLANSAGPAAKRLAIVHLKQPLQHHLTEHRLEWRDILPVLEAVDSVDELVEATLDTAGFIQRLLNSNALAAYKLAMAQLRNLFYF